MIYFHTAQYFLQGRLLLYNYVVPNKIIILLVSVFFFLFFFFLSFLSWLTFPKMNWCLASIWRRKDNTYLYVQYDYTMKLLSYFLHSSIIEAFSNQTPHYEFRAVIDTSQEIMKIHTIWLKFSQNDENGLKISKIALFWDQKSWNSYKKCWNEE